MGEGRSVQQERAIQAVIRSVMEPEQRTHLVLEAVAGAGKTFTLLEMVTEVRRVRPQARILLLAFNVEDRGASSGARPSW